MAKFFIICLLVLNTLFASAQNIRTISIDAGNASLLNLSEIAEKVTPIVLGELSGGIQNVLMTSEYLFMASLSSIVQYNLSGKFIRKINCGGPVTDNLTSDTIKKELYVPVRDKIKCYDYSGNFKKEYSLKTTSTYCLYHKGVLWVQSYYFQPDTGNVYIINKINLSTGEITTLPFEKKDEEPFKTSDGSILYVSSKCSLNLYNDEVIASFAFDNSIYKIQHDKVIPLIKWNITPHANRTDLKPMGANCFIGEYLFINYRRDDRFYFYLENMKTGKKFNATRVIDDIFHTDGDCRIRALNKTGYFYFIKENYEIKGGNMGNIPIKNSPVVFIVKTK